MRQITTLQQEMFAENILTNELQKIKSSTEKFFFLNTFYFPFPTTPYELLVRLHPPHLLPQIFVTSSQVNDHEKEISILIYLLGPFQLSCY